MTHIERLIANAVSDVGYIEKATNSQLDDKTANAGNGNFTKFGRDADNIPNFFNTRKQGAPWCDVYVDMEFVYTFGVEAAKKLLCQPDKSCGAGCKYSAEYYKAAGRFHKSNPQPGDQIFFYNKKKNGVAHTGLVTKVDAQYVYTVEGNTSSASGVVDNGGGVWEKFYKLDYDRIYGYGRPDYDGILGKEEEQKPSKGVCKVELSILKNGDKGDQVKALQILLIGNGFTCGGWGADGRFGASTEKAVREYQKKKGLSVDGKVGPQTWGSLLGA